MERLAAPHEARNKKPSLRMTLHDHEQASAWVPAFFLGGGEDWGRTCAVPTPLSANPGMHTPPAHVAPHADRSQQAQNKRPHHTAQNQELTAPP